MTAALAFPDDDFPDTQTGSDSQNAHGFGESNSPQPIQRSESKQSTVAAPNFPDTQKALDSQPTGGVGDQTTNTTHVRFDSQRTAGGVGLTSEDRADAQHRLENSHRRAGLGPILADPNFPDTHIKTDSQVNGGVGEYNSLTPICHSDASLLTASAPNFPDTQESHDSQVSRAVGDQTTNTTQPRPDSQRNPGGVGLTSEDGADAPNRNEDSHNPLGLGPILADPTLAMCADVVDDLEKVRTANENRLRTLTAPFDEHGFGMTVDHPDIKRLAALVDALKDSEHQAVLNLQRVMRKHPLGEFVKNSKGIGEKQAARLLASIRDPYWNDLHGRPRTVRELYRFCGMDVVGTSTQSCSDSQPRPGAGVAPTKQRGERVTWSPDARMRLWLIASKCVMVGHGGPYRAIYDEGRAKYADAVHTVECKRCGPKGKPAQPGSPLSAAHQHARAIRLIAKAILRDLWTEAKRIHQENQK